MKIQRQMYYGSIKSVEELTQIVNEHVGYPAYVWLQNSITIDGIVLPQYMHIFIFRCGAGDTIGMVMYPIVTEHPVYAIGRGNTTSSPWHVKQI